MATSSIGVAAPGQAKRGVSTGSRTGHASLIGALFLSAFLFYGVGNGLVLSVVGVPDFSATVSAHQTTLALGVLLMLSNSVAVVGLGVLFFPILEKHGERTALTYLASRIVEAVFLAVGVVSLLVLLPAGHEAGVGDPALALRANATAYQVAMASLGAGSIFLCALLLRTGLVPRFLAAWGLVGYAVFLAGAIAEISGYRVGLVLAVPGGLFELAFGSWLIVRGFRTPANDRGQS